MLKIKTKLSTDCPKCGSCLRNFPKSKIKPVANHWMTIDDLNIVMVQLQTEDITLSQIRVVLYIVIERLYDMKKESNAMQTL